MFLIVFTEDGHCRTSESLAHFEDVGSHEVGAKPGGEAEGVNAQPEVPVPETVRSEKKHE